MDEGKKKKMFRSNYSKNSQEIEIFSASFLIIILREK
jgi:hypothetical protein